MLLWLQLSSVVLLDCHLILIIIEIISWTFEKKPFGPISDEMLFGLNQIYHDIMYGSGVACENNAVDLIPYQKQGKTIPGIESTLLKMHGKVSLDILAFFLLIHSERAFHYYCGKRDIRRSTQNIIALVKSLLFSKKMHSFGGRPRESIQI